MKPELQNSIIVVLQAAAELTPDGVVLLDCGQLLVESSVDPAGPIEWARVKYKLTNCGESTASKDEKPTWLIVSP
jgi:hypothetical protein